MSLEEAPRRSEMLRYLASSWHSQWVSIACCVISIIIYVTSVVLRSRLQPLKLRNEAKEENEHPDDDQSSRPASDDSTTQSAVAANYSQPNKRIVRPYSAKLVKLSVQVKTNANAHRSNPGQCDIASFAANVQTRHPGIDVISLSIREGCIIAEAQFIHPNLDHGSSSNLLESSLVSDFVNQLHLEQEKWDISEPKRVRVYL